MSASDWPNAFPPREEATRPPVDPPTERAPAWELVETGRYRPRRIRGSFPGRELG
jgi:hypothetical protein